jgi:hypothetical protein
MTTLIKTRRANESPNNSAFFESDEIEISMKTVQAVSMLTNKRKLFNKKDLLLNIIE